ncbi:SDR family oxidoreductase [Spirochaetia bacterium 38H-sp]|uniref:SDR family oxidoreductase n=1 Tax=Rarispira pelagica TaxID=3141764 RepID=A0ABU9U998_9SPIR
MSHNIKKKKAMIIGGSGGIGKHISLTLAKLGVNLIIHGGKDRDKLNTTLKECKKHTTEVSGFLAEISREKEFIERCVSFMPVDILIISAGPVLYKEIAETTEDEWDFIVKANFTLPSIIISKALKGMIENGYGRIILMGGNNTDHIRGYKRIAAYSAAKTALGVIAKSIANSYSKYNISCNILCPGVVLTEYQDKSSLPFSVKVENHFFTDGEDIAEIVADIVKKEKPVLNGAIISVDKGFRP